MLVATCVHRPGAMIDDAGGSKLSLDKVMEELGVTFSYVSEFLRKVGAANLTR